MNHKPSTIADVGIRLAALIAFASAILAATAQSPPPPTQPQRPDLPPAGRLPSLTTDKPDYAFGARAVFTGNGFQPNEAVQIQVVHADRTASIGEDHLPWDVTADANGQFTTAWEIRALDAEGALFSVSATAKTSGLTASRLFTDGPSTFLVFNSIGQGWYTQNGEHLDYNANYLVGFYGQEYRNFFIFDLSSLDLTGQRLIGATLSVMGAYETHNADLYYDLFDVTTPADVLAAYSAWGSEAGTAIFDDLGTGETYGTLGPLPAGSYYYGGWFDIPLSAVALAEVAGSPARFSIGGRVRDLDPGNGDFYLFGSSGAGPQQLVVEVRPENDLLPIARCKNVTVQAGPDCVASASVDNGSYDLNGNAVTITQGPPGPYPVGTTPVTLTVQNDSGSSTCLAEVTVLPPPVACITVGPGSSCVEAQVSLSPDIYSGDVLIRDPGTMAVVASAHFQDSLLPRALDIAALPLGNYVLCVQANGGWPQDSLEFEKTSLGQTSLIINGGPGCEMPPNRPPVAKCQDVTVSVGENCLTATALIDSGSYDPDGDEVAINQNPPAPYPVGTTYVELIVTDSQGLSSSCWGTVTVVGPAVACISVSPAAAGCLEASAQLIDPRLMEGFVNVVQVVSVGPITFTKLDSDPDDGSVSDNISANLRITRGSSQGVYNLGSDQIEWATGTVAAPTSPFERDFNNLLRFYFRPVDILLPGSDTVLHNLTTDEYYDIHWNSWSRQGAGGFSYTRVQRVSKVVASSWYTDSQLPAQVDLSTAPDGELQLCVSARPALPPLVTVAFTKPDFADASVVDVISPNLTVARESTRGVFNAGSDQIEWAKGTVSAPTSSFYPDFSWFLQDQFRYVNGVYGVENNLPGSDTVLHNITTGEYYDVQWSAWGARGAGGFAYTRVGPFGGAYVKVCMPFTKAGQSRLVINGPGNCELTPNRAPIAKCRDVTVGVTEGCSGAASIDYGSLDPDGNGLPPTQDPPGPYPLGTTVVTLTITDTEGLSSSCSAKVEVVDRPGIRTPGPLRVGNDPGQPSAVVTYDIAAASCTPVFVTCDPPSGSTFPIGTTTVNCTAVNGVFEVGQRGFIKFDYFAHIPGSTVADLVSAPSFAADTPAATYQLPAFDSRTVFPNDAHELYGSRIYGVFIPPESGNWIFYLRSDDASQLFLNPSGISPVGKVMLLEEKTWGGPFSKHTSAPQALEAGQPYFIEVLHKEGNVGDYCQVAAKLDTDPTDPDLLSPIPGEYLGTLVEFHETHATFTVTVEDREPPKITCPADIVVLAPLGQCSQGVEFAPSVTDNFDGTVLIGSVLQEIYWNIPGDNIVDLRKSPKYPNSPDLARFRSSIEANSADEFDYYGTRISGFLLPPLDGDYVFYLASDNQGEFWLSTDASPANLVRLATEPVWAARRQWTGEATGGGRGDPPSNISPPVNLTVGKKYYFEAVMKEGTGGDLLAVAWQLPGGPVPENGSEPIGGANIGWMRPPPTVVCNPKSGSTFPVGTTLVTSTATDAAGNSSSCTFNVTVLGTICGKVFYDANANGVDDNELGLAGWKVVVTEADGNQVPIYTESDGTYCFEAPIGTYTVTEVPPAGSWVNINPTSVPVTLTSDQCHPVASFGMVCVGPPASGLGMGFWCNPNGQAVLGKNDPGWRSLLNGCSLRNLSGSIYTVPGGSFEKAWGSFQPWLRSASAKNMAYMLSAQLAATTLDVQFNGLSDGAGLVIPAGMTSSSGANIVTVLKLPIIPGPLGVRAGTGGSGALGNGFVTIGALRAMAIESLQANGATVASSRVRTYQECLKDLLDAVNNNGGGLTHVISPTPAGCPFTSPY